MFFKRLNRKYQVGSIKKEKSLLAFVLSLVFITVSASLLLTQAHKGIPSWVKTDIGPSLHEFGRPSEWKGGRISLDFTGFKASAGPVIYQDEDNNAPDYYRIDVEKQHGNYWYVYFQRDIKIEDVPNDFINIKASEVIEFDTNTNHVTFKIGNNKYEYTLPTR